MEDVALGQYALPPVLMVLLSLLYKTADVSNTWKPWIAVVLGVGLGMVALLYKGDLWTVQAVTDHTLYGLMTGASAVGLYEIQRTATNPRL